MTTPSTCHACGQLLPQARGRRICSDCFQPIRRHDKWFIGGDYKLHHKDCSDPELTPQPSTQGDLLCPQ